MRLLGILHISFFQDRSVGDPIRTNLLIVKCCYFTVNASTSQNSTPIRTCPVWGAQMVPHTGQCWLVTLIYFIRGSCTKEWRCEWFEVCAKRDGVKGRQLRVLGLDVVRIPPYPNRCRFTLLELRVGDSSWVCIVIGMDEFWDKSPDETMRVWMEGGQGRKCHLSVKILSICQLNFGPFVSCLLDLGPFVSCQLTII